MIKKPYCRKLLRAVVYTMTYKPKKTVITNEFYCNQLGNEKIVELLIQKGANIDLKGYEGGSALHTAVSKGKIYSFIKHDHNLTDESIFPQPGFGQIVDFLLQNGSDVKLVNSYGETPLHGAVRKGNSHSFK